VSYRNAVAEFLTGPRPHAPTGAVLGEPGHGIVGGVSEDAQDLGEDERREGDAYFLNPLLGAIVDGLAAMAADVLVVVNDISGHRREAIYYGAEQGIQKIGIALSALIFTQVLTVFGHTAEDSLGLRLIGPLAAVLAFTDTARLDPPAILGVGGSQDMADGNLTVEFDDQPWVLDERGTRERHALVGEVGVGEEDEIQGDLGVIAHRHLRHAGPHRAAGAILVLVGLIPSLYSYRRRVWVEAAREGDRTRVALAGVALQRKSAFADEFAGLREALHAELHGKEKS
jgi:hypothetical protein